MRPPGAQLLDLLAACPPDVAHLALAVRELVLSEEPDSEEVLYSVYAEVIVFKLPGRPGGAFCYVAAYAWHVNLGFYRGAELPDPHRVMKGAGKKMRHIRFDSLDDVDHRIVPGYIRAAIEQTLEAPAKVPRTKKKRL
jgi:hypothetical protein